MVKKIFVNVCVPPCCCLKRMTVQCAAGSVRRAYATETLEFLRPIKDS